MTNVTTQTPPSSRTSTAHAYGVPSATEPLAPLSIDRREVGPRDILIDIKFCGICHSDIHHCRGEWGKVPYPAVPGHEIAGVVAAVGDEVTEVHRGRPGRRRLHGELVRGVRELSRRATSSTAWRAPR